MKVSDLFNFTEFVGTHIEAIRAFERPYLIIHPLGRHLSALQKASLGLRDCWGCAKAYMHGTIAATDIFDAPASGARTCGKCKRAIDESQNSGRSFLECR